MSTGFILLIGIIIVLVVIFGSIAGYRLVVSAGIENYRKDQARKLKFLQVKVPLKNVAKSADIDARDHIQNMQQNIQIMNQIYKNVYALYDDSWKSKNMGNNYIGIELLIEKEIIKFILTVPSDYTDTFEKAIGSFYSGSTISVIPQPKILEAGKYMYGGEFVLKKKSIFPIKTYESFEADPMDSLLGAYSRLTRDEKLDLQILLSPIDDGLVKGLRADVEKEKQGSKSFIKKLFALFTKISGKEDKKEDEQEETKHKFSQQQIGDFDKKLEDELFDVRIRAISISPDKRRTKKIIDDLARAFTQYNYIGLNGFKFVKSNNIRVFAKEFIRRTFYNKKSILKKIFQFKKKQLLNIKEMSSLLHFPHSRFNQNPRLARQKSKIVPAPDNMPTDGMLLGWNEYAGIKKDIILTDEDRFRHVYIVGQTGTGKSTMILTQAREDLRRGNGFCVIDPHGELVDYLMQHYPKDRIDDLIYFDLSNTEYPIAFNPLDGATTEDERDVVTNDLVEMFVSIYGHEIFGPRIQDYFRNACFLLMEQPDGGTIVDIMRLFTDDAYAETKIRNVKNPVIASRWNKTYKKMGDREKAEIIPFIQAKFGPFTTGTYVRNIIGQPKSAFNFGEAMQEGKVILCKLAKGLTGESTSQLIGRMIAMQIKLAALKRASIPAEERKQFYLYVDEFQNYVSESFESILSEARKYRVGLTMAHQYIDQLKKESLGGNLDMSKTIFGNVGTIIALKVGAPDAEFLEEEFGPEFNKMDIQSSEKFKGVMKMSIDGSQSRPYSFTMKTPYKDPPLNTPEKIEIMKQISALKWGTKRELVDKEIYYRVGV